MAYETVAGLGLSSTGSLWNLFYVLRVGVGVGVEGEEKRRRKRRESGGK
jgi:hypothetical protein